MDRRRFLRGAAPFALFALAGCSGGEPTATDGPASPTGTASPTPSPASGAGGAADTSTATPTESTESPSPTETDAPTDSATDTEEPTASPTPADEATASPTSAPEQEIAVGPNGSLTFQPGSFTIATGDTVVWRWESGGHNVSPDEGTLPDGTDWQGKDDGTYPAGTTHFYTFDVAGDYEYHCDPHQSVGMVGSFTVE